MGAMGAILVTEDQVEHIPAPPVQPKSTVGAGDSMLAGIVWTFHKANPIAKPYEWVSRAVSRYDEFR
jgi:6-phosphofructokinase 2